MRHHFFASAKIPALRGHCGALCNAYMGRYGTISSAPGTRTMAKKTHDADTVTSAALSLAEERGWRRIALADIAARAGMPLAELVEHFPSKGAILDAYVHGVDARMLTAETEAGAPARDRLFDVVMRRFEAMAPHRRGLAAILRESGDDPWAVVCGSRRFLRSMALTLEAAGIPSSGLGGLVRLQGLCAIYLYTLRTFLRDDAADLGRTMAALDKALHRTEGLAAMIWGAGHPPRPRSMEAGGMSR